MRVVIRTRRTLPRIIPLMLGVAVAVAVVWFVDEFCMLTLNTHYGNVNPFWFAKHEGHHLVAKSEYGDVIEPDL